MSTEFSRRRSLESLKKEAKRWLAALRSHDADARARLALALPSVPPTPTLRDVQLALAREQGFPGWANLKDALERDTDASTATPGRAVQLRRERELPPAARTVHGRELMPMDIPDAGYKHIGRCTGLESLILMYSRDTTDAATEHITGLRTLRYYFNSYTTITDRTPDLLSGMDSLERITFDSCHNLTNPGVAKLARLPKLRELRASGRGVTRGVAEAFPATVECGRAGEISRGGALVTFSRAEDAEGIRSCVAPVDVVRLSSSSRLRVRCLRALRVSA